MLNEEEKKYWKKVYMYFGNDFRAWINLDLYHPLVKEYTGNVNIRLMPNKNSIYIVDGKFTQKFIDEISEE